MYLCKVPVGSSPHVPILSPVDLNRHFLIMYPLVHLPLDEARDNSRCIAADLFFSSHICSTGARSAADEASEPPFENFRIEVSITLKWWRVRGWQHGELCLARSPPRVVNPLETWRSKLGSALNGDCRRVLFRRLLFIMHD